MGKKKISQMIYSKLSLHTIFGEDKFGKPGACVVHQRIYLVKFLQDVLCSISN